MGVQQQYLSGLFFIAFGAFAVWAGRDLTIGTAAEMGIGYTPRALAIGCIVVGCILLLQAFTVKAAEEGPRVSIAWRPLVLVTLMVTAFGGLLPYLGLPITVALITLMAAASGETFTWPMLVVMAVGLAVMSLLLFSTALNLQIPVWPF
ncbi:MAG TPA: tripartite tricarboxylate transporter TctB family protein [Hyphomicrobiaceae bacterium]|nr:tripartite tricarboxylate transporter TctB family protein [Hyphomicrobiaceae bacterium]